ncbi:MAG: hypothetical protein SNJ74_11650 [Fimbriimonadaceae bacterium]
MRNPYAAATWRLALVLAAVSASALSPAPIVDREASAPGVTAPQREHTEEEIAAQQRLQGTVPVEVEAPRSTDSTFLPTSRSSTDASDVLSSVAEQKGTEQVFAEAERGMREPPRSFPWLGLSVVAGVLFGAFAAFRAWASRAAPPMPSQKRREMDW